MRLISILLVMLSIWSIASAFGDNCSAENLVRETHSLVAAVDFDSSRAAGTTPFHCDHSGLPCHFCHLGHCGFIVARVSFQPVTIVAELQLPSYFDAVSSDYYPNLFRPPIV